MISSFRRALSSWIMLGFLALAVLAMVVTGFGTGGMGGLVPGGGSSEALAKVNGETVTEAELAAQVNRQLNTFQREQPELDMATFLAGGAFDGVLNQLITGEALRQFARAQGLIVSERMIDREIVNIPQFRNIAGQFDRSAFLQVLQQMRMTEQEARDDIRQALLQRQLMVPVAGVGQMPRLIAHEYASLLLERRRGMIGVVPAEAMADGIAPNAQEVAAFYQQNQQRYTIPERRVIRYAVIGQEQVGDAARATDQEIAAYYQQNAATYGPRETRSLSQVVLPDQNAARQFMARLQGGASFEQAAGDNLITLGQQQREQFAQVANAEAANAVFAAAEGAVVGPIRSDFGFHVVKVNEISRTGGRPLESVRAEIVQQIEQRKLADALSGLVNRVEDRLSEGASLEEAARAEGLTVAETAPVTAAGAAPGTPYQFPAELAPVLQPAFDMTTDEDPVVETIAENERYALIQVARIVPAAAPPLAEIQERVREDLVRQRANERARAVAAAIVARINGGMSAREAFAQAGVRLPPPQPVNALRREIAQGNQVPPPLALMFSLPEGSARQLEAPNAAGWFIVHLEERVPGDASSQPQLVQQAQQQFSSLVADEYAQQFARELVNAANVQRNEEAIQSARQRLLTGTAGQ